MKEKEEVEAKLQEESKRDVIESFEELNSGSRLSIPEAVTKFVCLMILFLVSCHFCPIPSLFAALY